MARITRTTGAGKGDDKKPVKKSVTKKAKKIEAGDEVKLPSLTPAPAAKPRPVHDRQGRPGPVR